MKIAFISPQFLYHPDTLSPNADSPTGIWICEVARRLAQHCDVIVYAKKDRHQKEYEYYQGVEYRRLSTAADDKFAYIASGAYKRLQDLDYCLFYVKRPFLASSLYYLIYALRVAKDLRSEKCNIAHIQSFSQFVPIVRALNPKIKIVLHMRNEWLTQLDHAMIESRLRKVDLVIGCSEYLTQTIRRGFPQFAKRCQTVYNGVDVNRFVSENAQNALQKTGIKQLLFVGRVSPEKGVHILLEAFQKVLRHCPQAHLKIVGSKRQLLLESERAFPSTASRQLTYFAYLQQQLLSLKIADNVTFTGFIPYLQVINHYRAADVVVNPSFSESFGRSLIEAMACQVPVVATRVGGMTEIVEDGETGILVEPGDASALAEAILRLFADEGLRKSMGKAARKRVVELFSWEQTVENLLRQYKQICDGNE